MPDTTTDSDSQSDRIEQLEKKLEELNERSVGKNQIEVEAYDLSVSLSSEEADMETLAEIASEEMDTLTKRALVGEYQELEEQDLHGLIFGGD